MRGTPRVGEGDKEAGERDGELGQGDGNGWRGGRQGYIRGTPMVRERNRENKAKRDRQTKLSWSFKMETLVRFFSRYSCAARIAFHVR